MYAWVMCLPYSVFHKRASSQTAVCVTRYDWISICKSYGNRMMCFLGGYEISVSIGCTLQLHDATH
jgi:hypothetical protein